MESQNSEDGVCVNHIHSDSESRSIFHTYTLHKYRLGKLPVFEGVERKQSPVDPDPLDIHDLRKCTSRPMYIHIWSMLPNVET